MIFILTACPANRRSEFGLEWVRTLSETGITACSLDGAGDERLSFYRSLISVYRDAGEENFVVALPDSIDPATFGFWLRARARELCYQVEVRLDAPGRELEMASEQFKRDPSVLAIPLVPPAAPEFETPRLRLGWPTTSQLEGYFESIHGTQIFDTIIWDGPSSSEDLEDSYLRFRQDALSGPKSSFAVALIEKSTDHMIGGVGWRPSPTDRQTGDIGYALAPQAHGHGYATEAVREILRFAFEEREAVRIEAQVFVGNVSSRRVLEKNGFQYEGTLEQIILKRGKRIDEWTFALTRDRWLPQDPSPSQSPPSD